MSSRGFEKIPECHDEHEVEQKFVSDDRVEEKGLDDEVIELQPLSARIEHSQHSEPVVMVDEFRYVNPDGGAHDNEFSSDEEPIHESVDSKWVSTARTFMGIQSQGAIPLPRHEFDARSVQASDKKFYQPTQREIESHTLRVDPVIFLEIMSSRTMQVVLTVSYFAFAAAIGFGIFERSLSRSTIDYGSQQSTRLINSTEEIPFSDLDIIYTSLWKQQIPFLLHDRYFSLSAKFMRYGPDLPQISKDINVLTAVQVFSRSNSDDKSEELSTKLKIHINCEKRTNKCSEIKLFWRWNSPFGIDWQDQILDRWAQRKNTKLLLNLTVYSETNLIDVVSTSNVEGNLTYRFEKSSQLFWIIALVVELSLYGITFVFCISYSISLCLSNRKVVSEQKWVCFLLVSVLIFQFGMLLLLLPLQLPNLTLEMNRQIFEVTGNVLQAISTTLFGCFWFLIAGTIQKIAFGSHVAVILSVWKVILGVANISASVIWIMFSSGWEVTLIDRGMSTTSNSPIITMLYIGAICFWSVTTFIWFVWISKMSWSAYQELKFWNFQTTRFRQLSFRFFVNQSWLIILYFLTIWIVWFSTNFGVFGTRNTPVSGLGTFLMLTCYAILSAYVHFPVRARDLHTFQTEENTANHNSSGFSLNIARLMCDLSWQAYGAPLSDLISSPSKYHSHINVEPYGFKLINVGTSASFDIQWFVALSGRTIVVGFRGSRSSKNIKADLRVNFSVVNSNFWYTGDCQFVCPSNQVLLKGSTRVHTGFFEAYLSCREDIINTLGNLISDNYHSNSLKRETSPKSGPGMFSKFIQTRSSLDDYSRISTTPFTVFMTGHSLGAALATFCCLEVRCRLNLMTRLYTFGSPRVGSHSFARLFSSVVPSDCSFRLVFEQDVITAQPASVTSYKHINSEVYIDSAGNMIFSPSFVEKSMLPNRTRWDHHQLSCYRTAIEAACTQRGIPPRPCDDDFAVDAARGELLDDGI